MHLSRLKNLRANAVGIIKNISLNCSLPEEKLWQKIRSRHQYVTHTHILLKEKAVDLNKRFLEKGYLLSLPLRTSQIITSPCQYLRRRRQDSPRVFFFYL